MEKIRGARARRLTTLPLIAATFFMVSGGPYGLEELIQKAGFQLSILILIITPFLWSLPTALMLGELSAAIPQEGGFYVWVTRAMGPFWGFQEAWLSLAASIFDMAIYPTLFVLYLSRLWPWAGEHTMLVGGLMIALCALWNLTGARAVGDSSILLGALLLAPFAVTGVLAWLRPSMAVLPRVASSGHDVMGGIIIAMWNYMGWDNATTVAGEVDEPQRTYPRAILGAVALIALCYVVTVAAFAHAGIDPSHWETGSFVEAASNIGGRWLGLCIVAGGMVCGVGMFNALVMSYSRLPMILAEDGYLPRVLARKLANGVPWVAVLASAAAWTLSLGLSFERLVMIDVVVYGLSLLLEFLALVRLRVTEPLLHRPFRVPGGTIVAAALGIAPAVLIAVALERNRGERIAGVDSLWLALALIAVGPVLYWVCDRSRSGSLARASR